MKKVVSSEKKPIKMWLEDIEPEALAQARNLANLPFTFNSRFEGGKSATNPEELIAAAHAGCYSMALSAELGKAGYAPESIETSCTIDMEGTNIVTSHLVSKARVPGISKEAFDQIAQATKAGCPVSRALNLTISLDASLV